MHDQMKMACGAALLVALVLGGIGGFAYANKMEGEDDVVAMVEKTDYQAIFLTNGQLYFGKLSGEGTMHPVLTDIYYLQTQQTGVSANNTAPASPQVQLVKFGAEIQGAMDEMRLNPTQIMMIEDLREDGQVVTSIRKNQAATK